MTNSTEKKYFDVITRGVCYMNRARVVKPKGASSYVCVNLIFLEGDADNLNYVKMDAIVRSQEACELVQQFEAKINSDADKVVAVVQVGGLRLGTFVAKSGAQAGTTFACLKTNLLKIDTMKLNGDVVYTKPEGDAVVEAEDSASDVNETPVAEANADAAEASLPPVVKLDRSDADFDAKKSKLKAQGYRWDSSLTAWTLAA